MYFYGDRPKHPKPQNPKLRATPLSSHLTPQMLLDRNAFDLRAPGVVFLLASCLRLCVMPVATGTLSLSPHGRELVSAGHDESLRFWSLEKRSCTQEIISHCHMRVEGVCTVIWSQDGRWVISGGGDGVIKVFAR